MRFKYEHLPAIMVLVFYVIILSNGEETATTQKPEPKPEAKPELKAELNKTAIVSEVPRKKNCTDTKSILELLGCRDDFLISLQANESLDSVDIEDVCQRFDDMKMCLRKAVGKETNCYPGSLQLWFDRSLKEAAAAMKLVIGMDCPWKAQHVYNDLKSFSISSYYYILLLICGAAIIFIASSFLICSDKIVAFFTY